MRIKLFKKTVSLLQPESYKVVVGQWSFFALVIDAPSQRGLIQVDYAYGYNNGTSDFKVVPILTVVGHYLPTSVTSEKLPNVYKSCPIMIPLEIKKDFDTFTKICINCGRFGQNNCCTGFEKLPNVQ